jgi:hypothetical protein
MEKMLEFKTSCTHKLLIFKNCLDGKTSSTKKTIWIQKLIGWKKKIILKNYLKVKNRLNRKISYTRKFLGLKN